MKVMLIQLPHFYENTARLPTIYPLGIAYLSAVLKKEHELIPMDLWIENARIDKAMSLIRRNIPDVFCISVYSTQYPYFKELVSALKSEFPSKLIIAGGPGATFSHAVFLKNTPLDFCVIGEGEITLKELLANLTAPEKVKGIAYKKDNSVLVTAPREQIKDLDSLPFPDRDFFDMERYIENRVKSSGAKGERCRGATMLAGRGCPYLCTFCSKTFSGIRLRSISAIEKEFNFLKLTYSLDIIEFDDELVLINKQRTLQLCSILKNRGARWGCQGRINAVDEEILRAMKDSGCIYIGYGVESYTQNILDNMKKNIRVETIIPVIEMTKRIGLEPLIQYMYGFPGEDDNSIERTVEFFKKVDYPYYGFVTTPIPGTEIYRQAMNKGLIKDEEAYLVQLTSGYNRYLPLVNLTGFTDAEFTEKRLRLTRRLNRIYYTRHPFKYISVITAKFGRYCKLMQMLISNPKLLINKISKRFPVLNISGKRTDNV